MDGAIATPDWEACETCVHMDEFGCEYNGNIDLVLHELGDWILCEQWETEKK